MIGLLGVAVLVAAACELPFALAGTSCSEEGAYAQDGIYALKCEGGIWTRGLTTEALDDFFEAAFGHRPDPNPPGVAQIATRGRHACALSGAGGVKCWGANDTRQLGDGTTTDRLEPVQVTGLTSGVTSIAAGSTHTCAVHNGAAKCWGGNDGGQLGNGTTTNSINAVQVTGLTSGVTAIAAGPDHSCAIHNGAAKCWGFNGGRLGNGSTTESSVPVQVTGLTTGVTHISGGADHSCAIHNGAAKCWGYNGAGRLGDGTTTNRLTPIQVSGLTSGMTTIETRHSHTCASDAGGAMKCWGSNAFGQLGDGTTTDRLTPIQVSGLTAGVTDVAAAAGASCAVQYGTTKCWGRNADGELGTGNTTSHTSPVQVSGFATGSARVEQGSFNSCGVTSAGVLKCWGSNSHGQLGNGTTTNSAWPVTVIGAA